MQAFDAATARSLAVAANDALADAIKRHPTRYAGMAAIAPQDPAHAAREMERAVRWLGFKGVLINSHTQHEYLDDPKFWGIFEAVEALDVPLYLHPNTPSKGLIGPLLERGLETAIYGFSVDLGMHILSLICTGVFDRFPKLRVVVGHLGEALPFWLFRLDYFHAAQLRAGRYPTWKRLERRPSEYLRERFWYTTSGMPWAPAITFCQQVLGLDRVMYAMDYPYEYELQEVIDSDSIPVSAADKKRFFQTNAEALFRLA